VCSPLEIPSSLAAELNEQGLGVHQIKGLDIRLVDPPYMRSYVDRERCASTADLGARSPPRQALPRPQQSFHQIVRQIG
jgi:hypothetical protein